MKGNSIDDRVCVSAVSYQPLYDAPSLSKLLLPEPEPLSLTVVGNTPKLHLLTYASAVFILCYRGHRHMRLLVTLSLQCLNQDSQRRNAMVQRIPQYELLFHQSVVERFGH